LQGLLFGSVEEYWFTASLGANMIAWYVDEAARGSPMAVKLLLAFKRWAENRGANELTLSITSGLRTDKTARFLRRMGFEVCGGNYAMPLRECASINHKTNTAAYQGQK
jgi:GNAT superfamily N-acetyltransferase